MFVTFKFTEHSVNIKKYSSLYCEHKTQNASYNSKLVLQISRSIGRKWHVDLRGMENCIWPRR